jgi:Ca2+/Na+ antiporter
VAAGVSFALLLLAILPYLAVSVRPAIALPRFGVPQRAVTWLTSAISEEEAELRTAIHPNPAGRFDAGLASIALVAVIVASSAMESAGSDLGRHFKLSSLVIGGLVLAAVTSLPNAVAAVYLAAKGRGAAVLSEAMNSNMLNVLFGLLMPALWLGLPSPSRQGDLVAGSYGGLTLLALLLAFAGRGLTRVSGVVILVGYLGFVLAALRV